MQCLGLEWLAETETRCLTQDTWLQHNTRVHARSDRDCNEQDTFAITATRGVGLAPKAKPSCCIVAAPRRRTGTGHGGKFRTRGSSHGVSARLGEVVEATAGLKCAQLRCEEALARNACACLTAVADGRLIRATSSCTGAGAGKVAALRHATLCIGLIPATLAWAAASCEVT